MVSTEVDTILEAVPEFVDRFLDLVEMADGDPGAPAAFTELADFVASAIDRGDPSLPVLVRCLGGVEQVARASDEAEELVAWSFLDSLCPEDLRTLQPWFGPRTRAMVDLLTTAGTDRDPPE